MDIKLDISPEQINKYVADSVLNSLLGEKIKVLIENKLKNIDSSWNNPISQAVDEVVKDHIKELLRSDEYAVKIKEQVNNHIQEATLTDITSAAWNTFLDAVYNRK